MKKFVVSIVVLCLMTMLFSSCTGSPEQLGGSDVDVVGGVDVVGEFDGNAVVSIYSDSELTKHLEGKCEIGETYYVSIDVQIERTLGVVLDKVKAELSVEFPKTEDVAVAFWSGPSMTGYVNIDTLVYNCTVSTEGSYNFVFKVTPSTPNAFDIKVLIDGKLVGSKIIDVE